jgi:hypothetical protein
MDSTVGEHIRHLKARIGLLSQQIAENQCTQLEVQELFKAELGIAFLAIAHYEAALKEEHKLASLEASKHH